MLALRAALHPERHPLTADHVRPVVEHGTQHGAATCTPPTGAATHDEAQTAWLSQGEYMPPTDR